MAYKLYFGNKLVDTAAFGDQPLQPATTTTTTTTTSTTTTTTTGISPVLTNLLYLLDASNGTSWPGSGTTWFDISGQSNDATLVNGLTYSTAGGAPSMFFDGTNDYATFGVGGVPQPTLPITWNFWFKAATSIPYQPDGLFDTGPGLGNVMRQINDNAYTGTTNFPTVEWSGQNPTIPLQGYNVTDWNQFTFVYNYSTNRSIKFYINGVLVTTVTGNTTSTLSWTEVVLGAINKNAYFLNGYINNAALYDVELNSTQITQNYNAYSPRFTNPATISQTDLKVWTDAQIINSNNGQGTTWWNVAPVNYSGSLLNGAAFTAGTPKYIDLDGTNDYIRYGDIEDTYGSFTAMGWVYFDTLTGIQSIISKWSDTGNQRSWMTLKDNNNGQQQAFFDRSGNFSNVRSITTTGTAMVINTWYQVAITYDSTTGDCALYRNGVSVGTATFGSSGNLFNSTSPLQLGLQGEPTRPLNGRYGQFLLYKRALTGAQITTIFDQTKTNYGY